MLDREGYRPNVGIILCNAKNEVFWGKRIREHSWQFPQGGIKRGETPEEAMYRELYEEVGLRPEHVRILGRTKGWLRYEVPTHWIKREWRGILQRAEADMVPAAPWLGAIVISVCAQPTSRSLTPGAGMTTGSLWMRLSSFKRTVYEQALNELVRFIDLDRRARHKRIGAADGESAAVDEE